MIKQYKNIIILVKVNLNKCVFNLDFKSSIPLILEQSLFLFLTMSIMDYDGELQQKQNKTFVN